MGMHIDDTCVEIVVSTSQAAWPRPPGPVHCKTITWRCRLTKVPTTRLTPPHTIVCVPPPAWATRFMAICGDKGPHCSPTSALHSPGVWASDGPQVNSQWFILYHTPILMGYGVSVYISGLMSCQCRLEVMRTKDGTQSWHIQIHNSHSACSLPLAEEAFSCGHSVYVRAACVHRIHHWPGWRSISKTLANVSLKTHVF